MKKNYQGDLAGVLGPFFGKTRQIQGVYCGHVAQGTPILWCETSIDAPWSMRYEIRCAKRSIAPYAKKP